MPNPLIHADTVSFFRSGVYFKLAGVKVYSAPANGTDGTLHFFDATADGFLDDTILQRNESMWAENGGGLRAIPTRQAAPTHPDSLTALTALTADAGGAETILRIAQDLRSLKNDDFRTFASHFTAGDMKQAKTMHAYIAEILTSGNVTVKGEGEGANTFIQRD